ncbi:ATP-binding cassette domain-containing protein [Streptomyces sp. NPDC058107]|uniref:ATP-binding cassette domain-containing protein n=1 Tax=Streptomyces sp. NPDC058107 TaxID=3346343 RepID=UPI0036EEB3A8
MTTDECVSAADGVRRRYAGGFEAVTGISFSVARGEIFALLGTNGAGKTSTVELLEGLARPDGGTVRVLGHDPYRGRAEAVDQMVEVQRIARASQQEVRDVVRGCREADLSTELVGAQGVLKAAGIVCDVTGDGGGQLPAAVQSALGWAVREAATEVLRHGDPRLCPIRLSASADGVVLDVENDGAPCTAAGESGSGLSALDGSLDAGPVGDGMFRLTARIPLTRGESRPAALEGRR